MVDYREILRLSNDPRNSKRGIASMLHCSHHTVSNIQAAAKEAGVQWPLDDDVTNAMLRNILFPTRSVGTPLHVEPDFQYIHMELTKSGVNLTLLWTEYYAEVCGDMRQETWLLCHVHAYNYSKR